MGTKKRNIENPSGQGNVFKDDIHIATVRYSLKVDQEILIQSSLGGTSEMKDN